MVRVFPEEPRFTTGSERHVFDVLVAALGEHDVLLPNLRLTDENKDHELDLVVLMPETGVLVLEVKGGSVHYDNGWMLTSGGSTRDIHPGEQAQDAKYALREHVELDPRWGSRGRVAWSHGVVTPYSAIPENTGDPSLPRWMVHDKGDLPHLIGRLRRQAQRGAQGHPVPRLDDVEAMAEILTSGPHLPYDVNAEAAERTAHADQLTDQQATILQVTRLLRRVEVRGGAGTGKTALALQQAKELTRGRQQRKPERVALLCYSIGLAEHLRRVVATWPRKDRPAFVGTFAALGRQWGAPDGARDNSAFWEVELPQRMSELAAELPDGHRFDSIVVDEAQDFADSWWTPLMTALRCEEDGGLYVFSDENQRIFARFGRPPVPLVPLVLDHNLRNTTEIHDAFAPLAPSRMYARGGHGPRVQFVPSPWEKATEAADDEVITLLDAGWEEGRVALITTGSRHETQEDQQTKLGQEGYWATYFDGEEVFYGHVLGCKGLERAAVVLCLNEDGTRDRATERLYVGMSRATDLLVVVGDPDVVRRVGGPQVAARLNVPGH